MKVIKKGRPQKGWSAELICSGSGNGGGGCNARLLVEQADLFKTHSYVHVDHDVYITFRCVDCGVLTDVPSSLVPSSIQAALPDKDDWVDPNSEKAAQKKLNEAQKLLERHGYHVRKPTDAEIHQEYMGS